MSTTDVTTRPSEQSRTSVSRWVTVGLFALPAYGLLTFASALHPQPDPTTDYPGWARFVTTDRYLIGHLLGSTLGLICAVFGVFALGSYLSRSRAATLGATGAVVTLFAQLLFLSVMGTSAFMAPATARAYLAGVTNIEQLQQNALADLASNLILVLMIVLNLVGNVLLGVAVWRSGTLPRAAGALWVVTAVLLYLAGLLVGLLFTHDSPPTEPIGALLVAVAGGWIAWSARRRPAVAR